MNRSRPAAMIPLLCVMALSAQACTTQTHFPSLLPRPIESRDDLEPARETPEVTVDVSIDTMIDAAEQRLAANSTTFLRAADQAMGAVAAAGNADPGSDAWLSAQRALSMLDAARTDTLALAADLDRLTLARARDGKPIYPTLDALRQKVEAELDSEAQRIDGLRGSIKPA